MSRFSCLQPAPPPQRPEFLLAARTWQTPSLLLINNLRTCSLTLPLPKTLPFRTFSGTLRWQCLAPVQGISFLSPFRYVQEITTITQPRVRRLPLWRRIQFLFFIVCTDCKSYGRTEWWAAGLPMVSWAGVMALTLLVSLHVRVSGAFIWTRRF